MSQVRFPTINFSGQVHIEQMDDRISPLKLVDSLVGYRVLKKIMRDHRKITRIKI